MLCKRFWRVVIAEFIGTSALVFIGCGAIITNSLSNNSLTHVGISAAFGLIVMIMIYSIGNISGAHLNPAVTIGFFFAKTLKRKCLLPYILSQISGSCFAVFLLSQVFPNISDYGTTLPAYSWEKAFMGELIFTFILMFVIHNVSTGHMEKGIMAGVTIGATITVLALIGGPLSGASMNPARSIGPALFSHKFEYLWIYIFAPICGACLAAPVARLIQNYQREKEKDYF